MSRFAPLTQAIQKKYENDPQKAQAEIQQLYKDEGVSMMGGCLWSLLPLLLLFPLYTVIRQPLVYMLHLSADRLQKLSRSSKKPFPLRFSPTATMTNCPLRPISPSLRHKSRKPFPSWPTPLCPV